MEPRHPADVETQPVDPSAGHTASSRSQFVWVALAVALVLVAGAVLAIGVSRLSSDGSEPSAGSEEPQRGGLDLDPSAAVDKPQRGEVSDEEAGLRGDRDDEADDDEADDDAADDENDGDPDEDDGKPIGVRDSTEDTQPTVAPTTPVTTDSLILVDPSPAVEAYTDAIGAPVMAREVLVYPTYSFLEFQSPQNPAHLDEYTWRDGLLTGPEPVPLSGSEDLAAELFALDSVAFDAIPALAERAAGEFVLDDPEVTHVIIGRWTFLDDEVAIRIYVSDPVRGGGGYLVAAADGTFVEVVG